MPDQATGHLRQACKLTGAAWAAVVVSSHGQIQFELSSGLGKRREMRLQQWLSRGRGRAFVASIKLKRAKGPSRTAGEVDLGAEFIWGYPTKASGVLFVGAGKLKDADKKLWTLVADLIGHRRADLETATLLPAFDVESVYDSKSAYDRILMNLLGRGPHQNGWLAIRRGEQLVIVAARPPSPMRGAELDLRASGLLERMRDSRRPVVVHKENVDWGQLPHAVGNTARTWAIHPLVVGSRLIGAVATWGSGDVRVGSAAQFTALARQAARQVDLVVSLHELTSQLRRLARLNEFALGVSSAGELPELARRVTDHLAAIFPGKQVTLYVPRSESGMVREYRNDRDGFASDERPLGGNPIEEVLRTPAHLAASGFFAAAETTEASGRVLTLPLVYRQETVGALSIGGAAAGELSQYDRSLLAVVASYVAGVIEHSRLRTEALDRARRLEETVEQLREAQLAASTRLEAQQAAESRLIQAAKLAAVGEMAAGVAHELNNPLTTVSGFAELILDETPTDAPYRADLEMVLHEAHRARSVVRRLLDFARQGDHVLARADINEIVEDVLALMTHFIHTSGVQLETDLGAELPWITMDANQIKQVLLNLMHNALHAMPRGGRLKIRTRSAVRESGAGVEVAVTDTGIGMDEEELSRIFEPFFTTRADLGGTGLGLAVTYGIVTEHGGTIEVTSKRGDGSTFTVWLPS